VISKAASNEFMHSDRHAPIEWPLSLKIQFSNTALCLWIGSSGTHPKTFSLVKPILHQL